ncbi:hypothetical protein ACIQF6_02250 [Kitasatospora sp. NPDC092948]|uniref:hypothetical protein n=1 Tax=Kitasatospora sp. NPDC092948 TaxID=3364088 RepID=UPI0037F899FE
MLDTIDAVRAALRANDEQPHGRQRTVTAEELVDAAEQFDDPELLAYALLDLMEAYENDAERRKLPVVFARVVTLRKKHPEGFDGWAQRATDWRYKWVANALRSVPDVPLEAVRRWHGELREHYRSAGHDLQPYYGEQYHLAALTGQGVENAFELWAARARSSFSDCRACELRSQARHFVRLGDDERALSVWRPVFDGEHSCAEEPHVSRAHALLPLLRVGRIDDARSFHLTGYRWARGRSRAAEEIGLHLEFCALTGNEPRGLEILADNRDLFDQHGDPLARLHFLTGTQQLLARLAATGHGGVPVAGPPGNSWTVDGLLAELRTEGDALAARFDARGGTTAVGDARRERLARTPLFAEPLALGLRAATPAPAAAPSPAAAAQAAPAATESVAELVARARELRDRRHPEAAALWRRIEALAAADGYQHPDDPDLGPLDLMRAELAEQRARRDGLPDHELAAHLTEAAELYQQVGRDAQAIGCRALAAVLPEPDATTGTDATAHAGVEDVEDAGTGAAGDLVAELDRYEQQVRDLIEADAVRAQDALLTVLHAHAVVAIRQDLPDSHQRPADEPEQRDLTRTEAAVGRLLAEAVRQDDAATEVNAHQFLVRAYVLTGRRQAAIELIEQAERRIVAADIRWKLVAVHGWQGEFALEDEEFARAEELAQRGLKIAAEYNDRSAVPARVQLLLARIHLARGEHESAARAFTEAAARFDHAGQADDAASCRGRLGQVLASSGRFADAAAVLEAVRLEPGFASLDVREQAQIRLDLARTLRELDEHRPSAEEFLHIADLAAGWDDREVHTMVACEAAVALARTGQWPAADLARQRALDSHRTAPHAAAAFDMLLRLARITADTLGATAQDEALARLDEAAEVVANAQRDGHELGSGSPEGTLHDTRGRTLVGLGRPEEALAEMELAIAAFASLGTDARLARAESIRYAALIEGNRLDRTQDALTRLEAAIAWCREIGEPQAADVLDDLHTHLRRQH